MAEIILPYKSHSVYLSLPLGCTIAIAPVTALLPPRAAFIQRQPLHPHNHSNKRYMDCSAFFNALSSLLTFFCVGGGEFLKLLVPHELDHFNQLDFVGQACKRLKLFLSLKRLLITIF
jgi:hypothetical protein